MSKRKKGASEKEFFKALDSAIKKKQEGNKLKPSEEIAFKGKWYFNTVIDRAVIENILDMADKAGCRPHEIINVWIMKGYNDSLSN